MCVYFVGLRALLRFMIGVYVCINRGDVGVRSSKVRLVSCTFYFWSIHFFMSRWFYEALSWIQAMTEVIYHMQEVHPCYECRIIVRLIRVLYVSSVFFYQSTRLQTKLMFSSSATSFMLQLEPSRKSTIGVIVDHTCLCIKDVGESKTILAFVLLHAPWIFQLLSLVCPL